MRLLWEDRAWSEYLYWQTQDKKTLKRINALIKDIQRSPYEGIGKPEPGIKKGSRSCSSLTQQMPIRLPACSWRDTAYTPDSGLRPCSLTGGTTLPWKCLGSRKALAAGTYPRRDLRACVLSAYL